MEQMAGNEPAIPGAEQRYLPFVTLTLYQALIDVPQRN